MEKLLPAILSVVYILTTVVDSSSVKKGVGMAPKEFRCDDFTKLTNINWWYDWGASGVKQRNIHGCENFDKYVAMHVPMSWGNGSQFPNYNIQPTAKYLLGFNEPNHQAQSNLTAEQAYTLWSELVKLAQENNLILVSPAAAPCGGDKCNGNALEWFDEFFRLCTERGGCHVDHVATHVYYCTVNEVMKYLQSLWDKYNMPIWVTEFACPNETDPNVQLEFMSALLPKLEEAPYIFKYAWYMSRLVTDNQYVKSAVSLFEPNSPELSTLGIFYNNFGEEAPTTPSDNSGSTPTTTATATDATTQKTSSGMSKHALSNVHCVTPLLIFVFLVFA